MTLDDWKLSELGTTIWKNKYQHNNESFNEWLDRVSGGDKDIKQLIADKKFLFGGRILANRGVTDRHLTYSNCYVLPEVGDSIEDIYDTAKYLARTFSYGGGCGIDISQLRPKGYPVNNSAKTTTGAVSFMETFNLVSQTIGQEGRRGALMLSMNCNHPDILDFINAKKNTDKLNECNISVKVDSKFMTDVVDNNENKATELFNELVKNNFDYAEPGILFWDNICNYNLLSEYIKAGEFKYDGVNPCAEEPLPAGGSCLLGALNLGAFVTAEGLFDVPEFKKAVKIAIKGLNDVLDEGLPLHPLQIQRDTVRDWRQIGLGVMGFGDMCIKMKIVYGSKQCLKIINVIGEALVDTGLYTSSLLAKERGAFPKYNDKILDSTFITNNVEISKKTLESIKINGLRNSQLFTTAPTGSISTMWGISGGIEPIFDIEYRRTTKSLNKSGDKDYMIFTPIIQELVDKGEIDKTNIPDYVLATAKTINPKNRVLIQAQWQRFIDASISSTVNLPNGSTCEEIAELYILAWKTGCKGLTIYREGCKRIGILNSETTKEKVPVITTDTDIKNCIAVGTKLTTGCGSLWLTAYFNKESGQLCHIFLNKGSEGGCQSYMAGLSRMISYAGKLGGTLEGIVDQLKSVPACPSYASCKKTSKGKCCPGAVGNALVELYENYTNIANAMNLVTLPLNETETVGDIPKCPKCGAEVTHSEGCMSCPTCGWSKCN